MKTIIFRTIMIASLLLSVSCASTRPYIFNQSRLQLDLKSGRQHEFSYVRLYPENGELVLYGKVEHRHKGDSTEPHVDMALLGPDGAVLKEASLPLMNHGGRQHGWHGASFRIRLPFVPQNGQSISLAFHEPDCSGNEPFACGNNAATVNTAGP